jgi:hypothetical protein
MAEIRIACWRCHGKCQEFGWAKPGDAKQTWHTCPACGGKGWVMGTRIEGAGCVIVEPRVASPQEAMRRLAMELLEDLNGGPIEDITDHIIATSDETSEAT